MHIHDDMIVHTLDDESMCTGITWLNGTFGRVALLQCSPYMDGKSLLTVLTVTFCHLTAQSSACHQDSQPILLFAWRNILWSSKHVDVRHYAFTGWREYTFLPTCQVNCMIQLLIRMCCCRCEACTRCAGWWLLIHRSSLGRTVSILVCWWCKSEGACLPASARVAAEAQWMIRSPSLG